MTTKGEEFLPEIPLLNLPNSLEAAALDLGITSGAVLWNLDLRNLEISLTDGILY